MVPGEAEGKRPAARANLREFAGAALALETTGVSKLGEQPGVFPNLAKSLDAKVARRHGQMATGVDVSPV